MASKFRICPTECVSGFRQILSIIIYNIPVAAWPKASVCGHSHAGIMGSNPVGRMQILFLVCVLCCQVEVSAPGWSLVHKSPTESSVSKCDREASLTRRSWSTTGCCTMGEKLFPITNKCLDPSRRRSTYVRQKLIVLSINHNNFRLHSVNLYVLTI